MRIDAAAGDPVALARVLAEEDVRWVLVEKGTPGADLVPEIDGVVVHDGAELRLVDLGNPGEPRTASYAPLILGMDVWSFSLVHLAACATSCSGVRMAILQHVSMTIPWEGTDGWHLLPVWSELCSSAARRLRRRDDVQQHEHVRRQQTDPNSVPYADE